MVVEQMALLGFWFQIVFSFRLYLKSLAIITIVVTPHAEKNIRIAIRF
jgi:hypothetical protein